MHKFVLVLAALLAALPCGGASAETVQIVAFGGSNTRGKFLPLEDAYPAQLERMLRAEGYDVAVRNEGTNGQTTAEELEKLDAAVPAGTRIVLFQPGSNDEKGRRRVNSSRNNVRAIVQRRHTLDPERLSHRRREDVASGEEAARKAGHRARAGGTEIREET
jgi:lysophospholipase L1-like esterase